MARIIPRVIACMAVALLAACSWTSTDVLPPIINVSIGQQLIDLQKARESGAISQKEYQVQVRQVIDSVK
jgi:uncharacterized lipoprotein YbaY